MPLIEGSRVKGRGFSVRAWELDASSVKREDRGEHIVDLLRLRCRAAEGAHQPLIRIKASERASVLRAPGSLERIGASLMDKKDRLRVAATARSRIGATLLIENDWVNLAAAVSTPLFEDRAE